MNQAVYAEISGQERLRWVVQSGASRRWRSAGIHHRVARQTITYHHALRPLQRYTVDTRAVAMEGPRLWLEQHFLVGDRVHAVNAVVLSFADDDGVLSAAAAAAACASVVSDPLEVVDWQVSGSKI